MAAKQLREKVENLLRNMAAVVQSFRMYGQEHPITRRMIKDLHYEFDDVFSESPILIIGIIGKEVAFEKEPFFETSRQIIGFVEHLNKIQITKISFRSGLALDELSEFILVISMSGEAIEAEGGLEELFTMRGIRNVVLGELGYEKKEKEEEIVTTDTLESANKVFKEGEKVLEAVNDNVAAGRDIDIKSVRFFVNSMINNLVVNKSAFLILTAVKSHDEYSFVHNVNVAIFSLLQAEGLGLEKGYVNEIGVAALMHDVGKISIPREILNKTGTLSPEEFKVVKLHPVYGAKILLESPEVPSIAARVALEHHVRWDKSGYPELKYGRPTDLATMMVTIADVYDAMRSNRPYRDEMSPERTYDEMMRESGRFFNPDLLEYFFKVVGVFPPGTLVEMDSGEIGLVIKESAIDTNRPEVEVLYDSDGKVLDPPQLVKLMSKEAKTGEFKRSIKRSILPTQKVKIPEKYQI